MALDAIQLKRVQRGKKICSQLADGHGFPRTHDEIRQQHHPAGEVTDHRRKYLRGVGSLSRRVGQAFHPLSVNVTNRQQQHSADRKSENCAQRPAAAKPVVHHNQPAHSDHGAERQREIIGEAQFAREGLVHGSKLM